MSKQLLEIANKTRTARENRHTMNTLVHKLNKALENMYKGHITVDKYLQIERQTSERLSLFGVYLSCRKYTDLIVAYGLTREENKFDTYFKIMSKGSRTYTSIFNAIEKGKANVYVLMLASRGTNYNKGRRVEWIGKNEVKKTGEVIGYYLSNEGEKFKTKYKIKEDNTGKTTDVHEDKIKFVA